MLLHNNNNNNNAAHPTSRDPDTQCRETHAERGGGAARHGRLSARPLLLAPAGALIGAATGRSARAAAIGAIGGLNVVWALLVLRSDNGCTGYSAAFSATLALHPVIGIWPAPLLARAPAPPAG
jgi:hypothetical protein